MPVYEDLDCCTGSRPAYFRRMQSKSCFNFTAPDAALFAELDALAAGARQPCASGALSLPSPTRRGHLFPRTRRRALPAHVLRMRLQRLAGPGTPSAPVGTVMPSRVVADRLCAAAQALGRKPSATALNLVVLRAREAGPRPGTARRSPIPLAVIALTIFALVLLHARVVSALAISSGLRIASTRVAGSVR